MKQNYAANNNPPPDVDTWVTECKESSAQPVKIETLAHATEIPTTDSGTTAGTAELPETAETAENPEEDPEPIRRVASTVNSGGLSCDSPHTK